MGVAAVHTARWDPQWPPWALQTLGKHRSLSTEDTELGKGCSMWGRAHWGPQNMPPGWACSQHPQRLTQLLAPRTPAAASLSLGS